MNYCCNCFKYPKRRQKIVYKSCRFCESVFCEKCAYYKDHNCKNIDLNYNYTKIQSLLKRYNIDIDSTQLDTFLEKETFVYNVYPKYENIFYALDLCPIHKAKVVILGQDPYHGPSQAHGLAFSVQNCTIPPSLKNIIHELRNDTGSILESGDLSCWAKNGVLLLNCVLTVRENVANSHANAGWEPVTDSIIKSVQENPRVVFMLWGKYAQSKRHLIDETRHSVLTAPHPSPLSAYRGFYGCRHFSQANKILGEKIF